MASLKTHFEEEQKFTQWWLWVLLILIFLSPFISQYKSIVENGFWGTFSKGIYAHIITIGLVIVLFSVLKLKTKINSNGIYIHYFPFLKKEFLWKDIQQSKVTSYRFRQVRGWGIRFWTSYGTVYNVKGHQGLSIVLKNEKKYLIGTQKPTEMEKIRSALTIQKNKE